MFLQCVASSYFSMVQNSVVFGEKSPALTHIGQSADKLSAQRKHFGGPASHRYYVPDYVQQVCVARKVLHPGEFLGHFRGVSFDDLLEVVLAQALPDYMSSQFRKA